MPVAVDHTKLKYFDVETPHTGIFDKPEVRSAFEKNHVPHFTKAVGPLRSSLAKGTAYNAKVAKPVVSLLVKVKKSPKETKFDSAAGIGGHASGLAPKVV